MRSIFFLASLLTSVVIFIYLILTTFNRDDEDSVNNLYSANNLGYFFSSSQVSRDRDRVLERRIKRQQRKDKYSLLVEEIIKKGQLAQNDTRILRYINSHVEFLRPPPDHDLTYGYNLTEPDHDPSVGQSTLVRHALNDMKNGFFVEAGALDGETRSNTLLLEKKFGWKGLLVEADPKNYELLLKKNRKTWSSNTCLAIKPYPHEAIFRQNFNTGKISDVQNFPKGTKSGGGNSKGGDGVEDLVLPDGFVKVQCFPFFSLTSALNLTVIDYFSLDVEGSELEVLQTIPFDSIFIKVLSVEYVHDKGGRSAVRKFLLSKGFRVFGEVKDPRNFANDLIFINNLMGPHYNL